MLGRYDRGGDRVAVLVAAELEGLELELRYHPFGLVVALDDLGDLDCFAADLHHDVDVAEMGVTAAGAPCLVLPRVPDQGDMNIKPGMHVAQIGGGPVLISGLVL